jgi:hypothetical protein
MALIAVSADELEQRVRERADMVDSQFVTSAEVQRFLEAAWQELYSIMVASGEDLFLRRVRITGSAADPLVTENGDIIVTENGDILVVGGVIPVGSYVNLPAQMKALRLVRIVDGRRLRKATLHDLEFIQASDCRGEPTAYRLDMDPQNDFLRLELYPSPDRSYEYDVFYVPALSLREFIASSFVSIPVRGWDEYCVLTATAKCKDKEEADIGNVMKEREVLLERIRADLVPFDKSEPDTVIQMSQTGIGREDRLWDDGYEAFS